MKSSIILPLAMMGGTTTAFTIISSSSIRTSTDIATLPVSRRTASSSLSSAPVSVADGVKEEVEERVSDTRYPLSLSIPSSVIEEDNDEDSIRCIHYPTVDGTLPASTRKASSSSSSTPMPMPIANGVKEEVDDSVSDTRYPLSLSVPLSIVDNDDSIRYPTVNGWTADPSKFCYGLPGAVAPLGDFDPLQFSSKLPVQEIKRFREAEITHGRVAMLAVVGYIVAEQYHPFFNGLIQGPANTHLTQVREVAPFFFAWLASAIATVELFRANIGWEVPITASEKNGALGRSDRRKFGYDFVGERLWLTKLNDNYYPGDLKFDPLNLKPKDPSEFAIMQTKELQNGRLAMMASLGMILQEQITHTTLF